MKAKPVKILWEKLWCKILIPLALVLVTTLVYLPSINYPFQFDDEFIIKFHRLRMLPLKAIFLRNTRWLTFVINKLCFNVAKFNPFMYRTINIAIHILCGICVFFLLFTLLSKLKTKNFFQKNALYISSTTALFFLLHPVQSQTTSYISQGQSEGLATLCIVSICLFFTKFLQTKLIYKKMLWLSLTGIFCFLATGTKEIIIICPLLLVSIDWFFIAQGDWTTFKKRLSIYSFFFLVSVGILMVFLKPSFFLGGEFLTKFTHNNAGNTITNHYYDPIRPLQFFISEFQVILHYIFIFFWPFNISVEYDYKIIGSPLHVSCIVPLAFLILALYYTFKMLKLDPKNPICFGVIWFFLGLMLRSTIIPSPEMINDYKTYLSSIGILFLISSGVIKALLACCRKRERRKNCIVAFYIILIASLGFLTYRRNLVWSNKIKFWENALQQAPNKARTNNNYGVHLSENNQSGKATVFFKKAIKLDPYYPNPYNNLAMHYAYSGQTEKAIDLLKKCVQINPNYPEPYNNLSALLYQKGNLKLAEEIATQGRKTNKFYGRFDYTLGKIHAKKNDFLNAYRHFKICCTKKDFTNETGFSSYGFTALKLKKYDEAIFAYKQALEYKPNVTDFLANIGTAYFHKKQYEQAVFYFKKALKNSPKKLSIIFYLAETYLKAKNYKKALEQYQKCFSIEKKHSYPLKMELCLKKLGHRVEAQNIHNLLKQ